MSLPMTYSRRKRMREREGQVALFRNDQFGPKLLQQIFLVLQDLRSAFLGKDRDLFFVLTRYLLEELGVSTLGNASTTIHNFQLWWLYENAYNVEQFELRIDCIEVAAQTCSHWLRGPRASVDTRPAVFKQSFDKINARMLENGFGFQLSGGQMLEVTSEHTHEHAILPTLSLLRGARWQTANEEFRDALMEFRNANYQDCIADCGNAFESTLKIIAAEKGWTDVKPNDRAGQLIEAAIRNKLISSSMQDQFSGLRQVLGGVATVRNNNGGHGQGVTLNPVPRALASYQLNQTAAAILFLAESAGLS